MKNDQLPADVIVNGGQTIPVTLKDGTQTDVKVLLIPLSQAGKYIELISELTKFVEFVTKQPEGWADTLTDESVYEVDDLAKRFNDPRIDRFLERQGKTVERLMPAAQKIAGLTNSSVMGSRVE